jgi:hypothetical protein
MISNTLTRNDSGVRFALIQRMSKPAETVERDEAVEEAVVALLNVVIVPRQER